jgi:hypothetical protein
MKNVILIIGAIITLTLAILWYMNIINEPLFAIGTAVLTLISCLVIPKLKEGSRINQRHSGIGDNVVGDKIITNKR